MKKIFPVIIALITLSLLGIIYVQVSWLRNLALLREEQLKEKLSAVIQTVGEELVVQRSDAFRSEIHGSAFKQVDPIGDRRG